MNEQGPLQLRNLLQPQSGSWFLTLLLGAFTALCLLALLAISGWFITATALAGMTGAVAAFNYFTPAALIRFFALGRTAGRYGERLISHQATLALLASLRQQFFARFARHPTMALLQQSSARTLQKLVHDIDQLDQYPLRWLMPWCWALLLVALVLCLYALLAMPLFWLASVFLLLVLILPAWASVHGIQLARAEATIAEQRREALVHPLAAMTSLLMWNQWSAQQAHFLRIDDTYRQVQQRIQRTSMLLAWGQHSVLSILIVLSLWSAISSGQPTLLSTAGLVALMLALLGLMDVVIPLSRDWLALGKSIVARDRLNELLPESVTSATIDITGNALLTLSYTNNIRLSVQDCSVRFATALNGAEHINLTARSGEVIMVYGPSGCGKSTLLCALAGELQPQKGRIHYNDSPAEYWSATQKIGYLAQQWDIFDLSLAANLRLAKTNASDDELWQVLAHVGLHDWAKGLQQQLLTPLGEYGAGVSGGQARRIALARLLLKQQPILILDEPFAGVDTETVALMWQAIQTHQQRGILVIASHVLLPLSEHAKIIHLQ